MGDVLCRSRAGRLVDGKPHVIVFLDKHAAAIHEHGDRARFIDGDRRRGCWSFVAHTLCPPGAAGGVATTGAAGGTTEGGAAADGGLLGLPLFTAVKASFAPNKPEMTGANAASVTSGGIDGA